MSSPVGEPLYLLDTNILSDLVRHPRGTAAQRIVDAGSDSVCTSVVVACELRYGAAKKQSTALSERIDRLLAAIDVRALEPDVDAHYGEIRDALERAGIPIGANDLLIAAHARALGATCVTDNFGEFARVPGLAVENWLGRD